MKTNTFKGKLWKEITLVITIKLIAITLIWYCFFSDPVEKHLTQKKFADHLVSLPS